MQNETTIGNGLFQIIKGTALALGAALLAIIVFAGILQSTNLKDSWIYPINQTVKLLAIALGVLAFVRGEKGFLKGGAIALAFMALSYLTFSALGGRFSLGWVVIVELFLALITGIICGAIAVNGKRN
jgi:putative membrane protein (TIGR04086 family)